MDIQSIIKKAAPHLLSLIIILGTITLYYGPQLNNKIIAGTDVVSSTAWSKQVLDYKEETGILSNWNPSMFSGMPWGLLTAGYQYNLIRQVDHFFRLNVIPPMGIVIKAGLLTYISFLLLGLRWYIALLGALAISFNVNYSILLEAGHQSKLSALANFPLILSGLILCFKGNWKIGAPVIAVATSIAIANNHIQMVYYLLMSLVVLGLVYLIFAIKEKSLPMFLKMACIALGAALLGGLSNYSILNSARDFSDDTIRGKPILTQASQNSTAGSSTSKEGLGWDYVMQWSNDSKDLMSLFIPRFVGGSSYEEVSSSSSTGNLLKTNGATRGYDDTYKAPMYWGGLPFTSGPYYSGITILTLFFLGFVVVADKIKWGVGAASIIIAILSMGKNAVWLNLPLYEYLPLFNKFRAHSSAVNLLPIFFVVLAGITLAHIIDKKKKESLVRPLLFTGAGLCGILLLIALLGPSALSFTGSQDAQYGPSVANIFSDTRKELFSQDAWRSFFLCFTTIGLIYIYAKGIIKSPILLTSLLSLITFVDLYNVSNRHLDKDNWESQKEYNINFQERQVDRQIAQLEKKGRGYYRVFDIKHLASAVGSYRHNTIGGYHAAKLQRYEDMLTYHINKGNKQVLNMLNAKYIITQNQELQLNNEALGNAWCIQDIQYVNTALEEINGLSSLNTTSTAIIHRGDFADKIEDIQPGSAPCTIDMVDNVLNKWVYDFSSDSPQFVVFSEVWYHQNKGLKAFIDGTEVDFVRANYILRGLQVPAGQHKIEFIFEPVIKGPIISIAASGFIFLLVLFGIKESINTTSTKSQETKSKKKVKKKNKN